MASLAAVWLDMAHLNAESSNRQRSVSNTSSSGSERSTICVKYLHMRPLADGGCRMYAKQNVR
jgi:hypothetical protein